MHEIMFDGFKVLICTCNAVSASLHHERFFVGSGHWLHLADWDSGFVANDTWLDDLPALLLIFLTFPLSA